MGWLVWAGTAVTLGGIVGILACALAARAPGGGADDAAARARMTRLVAWNTAALGLSVIGLGLVIAGLILR